MESSEQEVKDRAVPLSIILEGRSWILTALLEATTALWMVSLAADGEGFFVQKIRTDNGGIERIGNFILYMVIGAISAGITVGALSLNFHPLELQTWRKRSCRSIFALVIVDLMAINHIELVVNAMLGDSRGGESNKFKSLPATTFLTVVGVCSTVFFNYKFIKDFGCCVCCCSTEKGDKLVRKMQDNPPSEPSNLPVALPADIEMTQEVQESDEERQETVVETERMTNGRLQQLKPQRLTTMNLLDNHLRQSLERNLFESVTMNHACNPPVEEVSTETSEETQDPVNLSSVGDTSKTAWKPLHRTGQLAFSCMQSLKKSLEELWSALKEEPGRFRYAVWIKSAFFTSVVVLIYSCIRSLTNIFSLVDEYRMNRLRVTENLDELDLFLISSGWQNGLDSIAKTTVVKLYLIADRVIVDFKWTSLAGYPLGTLFGLYGLVAVLMQHKRMSLAVSEKLKVFNSQSPEEQSNHNHWLEFQAKYPILGACFFLAILSSTAVLQSQIVGGVISALLGMAINLAGLRVLFHIVGFYLLAYIVVFVTNRLVMLYLQSSLITEDGYGIQHPRWFNFFMVVLSMVHLVIGILYALWRILYLLVTTVLVLNRLDVCLFTTGKGLDNGHRAFMCMLVLTVLIQRDSEKFKIRSESVHNQGARSSS